MHIERLVEDRRVLQLMNAEATAVPLTIQELLQASPSWVRQRKAATAGKAAAAAQLIHQTIPRVVQQVNQGSAIDLDTIVMTSIIAHEDRKAKQARKESVDRRNRPRRVLTYFNCDKERHFARDCPTRKSGNRGPT